jgi:hypothetical protein
VPSTASTAWQEAEIASRRSHSAIGHVEPFDDDAAPGCRLVPPREHGRVVIAPPHDKQVAQLARAAQGAARLLEQVIAALAQLGGGRIDTEVHVLVYERTERQHIAQLPGGEERANSLSRRFLKFVEEYSGFCVS